MKRSKGRRARISISRGRGGESRCRSPRSWRGSAERRRKPCLTWWG